MKKNPRFKTHTAAVVIFLYGLLAACTFAQESGALAESGDGPDVPAVAEKIDVAPAANDGDIAGRLRRIMEATGWFTTPSARVDEGVVFLSGTAGSGEHREWAGKLAANTEGVVAVVNLIAVSESPVWDLSPAWRELRNLGAALVRNSPLIGVALLLLVLSWLAAKWAAQGSKVLLRRRVRSDLLRGVAARAIAIPVFLLGLYLVLKVSGLTRLAVTVLGGTGLVGLILGFAFRDIAENFLASILLSMQRPFATGDRIEVAGFNGFVQSVNTRSTLLMTVEGNHVQIPNATIYKETITNFTANPNARFDFAVGIGYDDSISEAQSVALAVVLDHPGVVDEPEPLVLVEQLGAATINLRVYFWVNIAKFGQLKVRSAVIRLVKKAFDEAGISMPDEAREVVFPSGVPVHMIGDDTAETKPSSVAEAAATSEDGSAAHSAEGGLDSEAGEIQKQARESRSPETGQNLLES